MYFALFEVDGDMSIVSGPNQIILSTGKLEVSPGYTETLEDIACTLQSYREPDNPGQW
jgi:hypothetical protein